ncbi:MAG TPA: RNA polymerase sigma factor [Clostridium sp.]|nr:RNA polymerase sigma factor [Clostridium sp.]
MNSSLLRTDEELSQIYYRHVKTVYRVCYLYMKNQYDAEDMVQKAFIRLMRDGTVFQSEEHEKAWLIRTATNLCKDYFRSWWSRRIGLEEITDVAVDDPIKIDETLEKVMKLPIKYKTAIYMYYYEGFTTVEIAKILGKKESTIRGYLHSGRKYLKLEIGGEIK